MNNRSVSIARNWDLLAEKDNPDGQKNDLEQKVQSGHLI